MDDLQLSTGTLSSQTQRLALVFDSLCQPLETQIRLVFKVNNRERYSDMRALPSSWVETKRKVSLVKFQKAKQYDTHAIPGTPNTPFARASCLINS